MVDWTKVLSTGLFLAGAILSSIYIPEFTELPYICVAILSGIWALKPMARVLGMPSERISD